MLLASMHSLPRTNKMLKRKKSSLRELRMTIMGDRNVGKTAMVVRFITRQYIGEYDKGSDIMYRNEMIVDQDTVLYELLDPSSPFTLDLKRFVSNYRLTPPPDVFLLIYSAIDPQSFIYVKNMLKHLVVLKMEHGLQVPPVAIVTNKCDLIHMRKVTPEEGEQLLMEYSDLLPGMVHFGEISVAEHYVHPLFMDIWRWAKKFINTTQTNNNAKPPIPIPPPAPALDTSTTNTSNHHPSITSTSTSANVRPSLIRNQSTESTLEDNSTSSSSSSTATAI